VPVPSFRFHECADGLGERNPGLRPVDEEQVDVVEFQRFEAGLHRTGEGVGGSVLFGDLGGDPQVLAG
jgi:hypothetical protein